jgi:hypothetical protein
LGWFGRFATQIGNAVEQLIFYPEVRDTGKFSPTAFPLAPASGEKGAGVV